LQDEALTSEQRKLYIGKATKVSRVESEVLQKKTIKFQKVGVLEGKSRSAKASLYKCTAVRATREENEIFMRWRKPKVFNKRKIAFGRDVFALYNKGESVAENKDKLSFSVFTQKTHREIT